MKYYIKTLLLLLLSIFSCKKELTTHEETKSYCRENIQFTCESDLKEFFFLGTIKGVDFCISENRNGYFRKNGIGTRGVSSTEDPTFSLRDTVFSSFYSIFLVPDFKDAENYIYEDFTPSIRISTPTFIDTFLLKEHEYIEKFIKEGELLLNDNSMPVGTGFQFEIYWECVYIPGYDHWVRRANGDIPAVGMRLWPLNGPLADDTFFRVTEFKKSETPFQFIYDITFEIDCDLYWGDASSESNFYGRLEDGVFKTQIITER